MMELESMSYVAEELSSEVANEIATEAAGFFDNFGNIDMEVLMEVLKIMGLGMVGIFIVTCIIIAVVTLLNKVTSIEKKKKDKDNN